MTYGGGSKGKMSRAGKRTETGRGIKGSLRKGDIIQDRPLIYLKGKSARRTEKENKVGRKQKTGERRGESAPADGHSTTERRSVGISSSGIGGTSRERTAREGRWG